MLPPSRPSPAHLRWVRRQLRTIGREMPVCVLGSTPEYRDLLAELGFRHVTLIEAHPEFHARLAQLRVYRNQEEVIYTTWQAFFASVEARRRFAAILGHLTIGNVAYDERHALGAGIAASLLNRGIYLEYVLHQRGALYSSDAIRRRFRAGAANLATLNDFNCRAIFLADTLRAEKTVRPCELAAHYTEDPNPRIRWLARQVREVTPINGQWHYGRSWQDELAWRERHFTTINERLEMSGSYAGMASAICYGALR
ncbi:MAG TPA: hypothetical protein VF702_07290 [Allosphingosinicella sp.]